MELAQKALLTDILSPARKKLINFLTDGPSDAHKASTMDQISRSFARNPSLESVTSARISSNNLQRQIVSVSASAGLLFKYSFLTL